LADVRATALKPTASVSTAGSANGTRRGRTFWILTALVVLVAALGILGWNLLRDTASAGDPGDPGGTAGKSPHKGEQARTSHKDVEVPTVKGLNEQEARNRLDKVGFEVDIQSQESSEKNTGKVLEQSVSGGKEASKDSKIVLTIGEGPEVATVPDLVGFPYSEAEDKLKEAGFLLGGVKEVSSETVPAGVITDQDPQAGSTLDQGSYVYLTTSIGPPQETTVEP
jgi:eukaryotic-like serine/threonine-protein kinase